ncbi:MAG: hypothetical protein V2A34_09435, partial [Lentisphaerota bacterium]
FINEEMINLVFPVTAEDVQVRGGKGDLRYQEEKNKRQGSVLHNTLSSLTTRLSAMTLQRTNSRQPGKALYLM